MQYKLLSIFLSIFLISVELVAQNGTVRGSVFDAANGESLPGVTIFVEGTTSGTITDFDGIFNLTIEPGIYSLRISFISYETINLKEVEVKPGEVTIFDNIRLKQATVEISGVTVTAQAIRNTESALMAIKKKSANVMDGISAVNLRKIGDSDAAASMKRVSGVSVSNGKYVYVRGLGDRYTKTMLNGMDIPGLDPDRNSIQMDIFPTNIIDNIIVHKSFSAELPADFTGGVVDIELKEFPEKKIGSVSAGLGYNPDFHFQSDYLSYEGGKTDFLGFDDGTRDIPAEKNIPEFAETFGSPEKKQQYIDILNNFNPTMSTIKKTSFMDYDIGVTYGNQVQKDKVTLGYNFALSYKNNSVYYKNAEEGRFGLNQEDKSITEMVRREHQYGEIGINNSFISGLAGFALKTRHSKFRINILHLQNGESKAGIFDFTGSDQGSDFTSTQHNLDYSQRSLSNILLSGKHTLQDNKWEIIWKVSPTISRLDDPDIRFTRFEDRSGIPTIGTEVGFPERIWRALKETNISNNIHFTRQYEFLGSKNKLKFGGAYTYKERDYSIRKFLLNVRGGDGELPLTGDPDQLLTEDLLWPYNNNVNYGTTFETDFSKSNVYNAVVNYSAAYVSTELSLLENLNTIVGVRFEKYTQTYTGQNQLGDKVLENEKVLNNLNLFPSLNFIYNLTKDQNLRVSYSKTIARPSLKELSYAEIYDPISVRTFIGGLHADFDNNSTSDPADDLVYWDGNLKSTDIHNFDLRWELFAEKGQMVSLSGFYKKFYNPIEIVQFTKQIGAFQPRNVGDGKSYGAEFEFRYNLDNISDLFNNFSLATNTTFTQSSIKMSNTEYASRIENARTGENINEYRVMAGMAPIIINSGISYNGGTKGFLANFEAGLYYNMQGTTLYYVGIADRPNIYTKPFHSLNFTSSKKLGEDKKWSIGLKVKNILNNNKEAVYVSYKAADQIFDRRDSGISFSLSVKYAMF